MPALLDVSRHAERLHRKQTAAAELQMQLDWERLEEDEHHGRDPVNSLFAILY